MQLRLWKLDKRRRRQTRKFVICAHCRRPFPVRPTAVKHNRGKFCSRRCFAIHRQQPSAKWRDPEAIRRYHLAWAAANKDKLRRITKRSRTRCRHLIAAQSVIRRAIDKSSRPCTSDVAQLIARADGYCMYCGHRVPKVELDHIVPIARGGLSVLENLMPCCRACNPSKGVRPVEEWLHARHGIEGLARAVLFLEHRPIPEFLLKA